MTASARNRGNGSRRPRHVRPRQGAGRNAWRGTAGRLLVAAALAGGALGYGAFGAAPALAQTVAWEQQTAERASEDFPVDFLLNREVIVYGREVFFKRCTFCHIPVGHEGGHAPQLRPNALTADFIFNRVTNGFRLMPAWGPLISEHDRRAVVAYLLSDPRVY